MFNKNQKIASAILGGSLCVALIAGCMGGMPKEAINEVGTATVVQNGEIQPIMTTSERTTAFNDDGLYKITNVYGDVNYAADMAGLIGKSIPETELKLLNGEVLNTNDLKGKPFVLEVVANWCTYCKETSKEYMDGIVSKNNDLEFVQIFAEGNTGEVNTFYEEIGKDPKDVKYIVPATNEAIDLVGKLNITGFPTWIFIDETGRISWVHSGYVKPEEFSTLRDAAYTGDKLYDCLNEDFDDSRTGVSVNHIFDALSDEAISNIMEVEEDGQYMVYSNLNRSFKGFIAKNSKGEEVNTKDLLGKKIYLEINVADKSFTGTVENAKNNSKVQELAKEKGIETVQVWLAYYEDDKETTGADFRKANGLEDVYNYVFDGAEESLLNSIYEFDIYSAPSQLYINEDGRVVGATTGVIDEARFKASTDLYFGETPLYKQLSEDAETLNTSAKDVSKDTNVFGVATIVSGATALLSAGYLVVSKLLNKKEENEELSQE